MTFADVAIGEGWLVGIAGIVTAAGAVLVSVLNQQHRAKLDELAGAAQNFQAIIDRQERQIDRYEASQKEHGDALSQVLEEHSECRETMVQQQGQIAMLVDCVRRQHQAILDLGGKPDPLPDFAAIPLPPVSGSAQFTRRTLEQNAQLLQGIDERLSSEKKSHEDSGGG